MEKFKVLQNYVFLGILIFLLSLKATLTFVLLFLNDILLLLRSYNGTEGESASWQELSSQSVSGHPWLQIAVCWR